MQVRAEARPRDLRGRLSAVAAIIVFVFFGLGARLYVLQVLRGDEYAQLAEENHLKQREIPAPRGGIYDAHGHRIAEVRASYDLVISPQDVDRLPSIEPSAVAGALGGEPEDNWTLQARTDIGTLAARLATLLDERSAEEITTDFEAARRARPFRPALLDGDLSPDELERVLAARPWLPGVQVVSRHRRSYPDGALFAHLVGYMREVKNEDLDRLAQKHEGTDLQDWYGPGDRIGKAGLEAAFERWLRGHNGHYWVQVDVHGRELGRSTGFAQPGDDYFRSIAHFLDRGIEPEIPGHDLHLTVRRDLQDKAVELMGEQSGSVVMMEVHTGRVLAIANTPAFDPEIFSRPIPHELWRGLIEDPATPLVDKALQGIYPPGSTWKMIVAAAVLGSKTWTADTTVSCHGYTKIGRRRFHCWNRRGHGTVNLKGALKGSCDVYFYKAGLAAGIDTVAEFASQFGMGRPTGIGINHEKGALNPTTAWKKRRFADRPRMQKWSAGDTASAVIGQGFTLATPMQLARMTATLANGGTLMRPVLVDRVVGPDGEVVLRGEPEVQGYVDLADEHFNAIREGMYAVVGEIGGTARRQQIKGLPYAGKTGTAQVVSLRRVKAGEEKHKDHAWFVAFAPYDNPEVAIAVLVEHGEHGSSAAAPVARQLFESYFADRLEEARANGTIVGGAPSAERPAAPAPDAGLDAVPGLSPEDL